MNATTDPFAEFEAAQARLQAMVVEARANKDHASQMVEDAKTTDATARSPRGEVSVTSKVGGVIKAIQFSDAAMSLTPAALAALTTKTIADAQSAAAKAFADKAASQFGADSPIAAQYRADADRAFPGASSNPIQF